MKCYTQIQNICPGGGIGRRVGLKHLWGYTRIGSTPIPGTIFLEFFLSKKCLQAQIHLREMLSV